MRKIFILFKNQLLNTISINHGAKEKHNSIFSLLGAFSILALLCLYNTFSLKSIMEMGLYPYVMAYAVALAFFFVFLMSLFKSNSMFFQNKDFEILMSLPLKKFEILISKFLILYALNITISLSVILPGIILLYLNGHLTIVDCFIFLGAGLLVPIIPMCIASSAGVLIEYISSFFKKKNMITVVLISLLFLLYFVFISNNNFNDEGIHEIIETHLFKVFPLTKLFYLDKKVLINIGKYILLSTIFFGIYIVFFGTRYEKLNRLLNFKFQKRNTQEIFYKIKSPFLALLSKELKRYSSSSIYILNSSFSTILLCYFSASSIIFGFEIIERIFSIRGLEVILSKYGSLIISSFLVMSCTTSSSLSLEGNNLWILQSSPLDMNKIINSKIVTNLAVHFIAYIPTILMFILRLHFNVLQLIFISTIPILYSVFISVIGMHLNIKYINLKWNDEISVVKHSAAAILTNIVAIISIATPILFILLFNLSYGVTMIVMGIIIFTISLISYNVQCKRTLDRLY